DDDTAASGGSATTESGNDGGSATTGSDAGGAAGGEVTYEVTEIAYTDLTAPAGSTIDINNSSGAAHTFTADDGSFDEDVASEGTTEVQAPDEAGTYDFHCEIHPSMTATLTVE
ncbi:MAG TPA: cupredoxin domain-containing protein, partial [Acidimicrobiales bacterium]